MCPVNNVLPAVAQHKTVSAGVVPKPVPFFATIFPCAKVKNTTALTHVAITTSLVAFQPRLIITALQPRPVATGAHATPGLRLT